jgi:hypothetical protein
MPKQKLRNVQAEAKECPSRGVGMPRRVGRVRNFQKRGTSKQNPRNAQAEANKIKGQRTINGHYLVVQQQGVGSKQRL